MDRNLSLKGTMLKQVREAKGLTLQDIHESTKIPMDALRSIEEGYSVRTLSPFYIKGFLKMYAQFLGVDVKEVIEGYKPEVLPEHISVADRQEEMEQKFDQFLSKKRKQQIVLVLGAVIVFLLAVKIPRLLNLKFSKSRAPVQAVKVEKKKGSKKTSSVAQKEKPKATLEAAPVSQAKKESQGAQAEVTAAPRVETAPAVTPASETPKPAIVSPPKDTSAKKTVSVTLRARKNSWLQVKADGNVVFQSALKQGVVESWEARDTIEISGRNINELEFEVNGKLLGTLGREERQAKNVIVTKNGLTVRN